MKKNQTKWSIKNKNNKDITYLRNYLSKHSGIKNLEICNTNQIKKATDLFYKDGFVVVKDALNSKQLSYLKSGCIRVINDMLILDEKRLGNRGSHRYSFGSASITGHLLHLPEWRMLIDLPTLTPIITSIFESKNYIVRGGGGDFCLPGAIEYQALHSDLSDRSESLKPDGTVNTINTFKDPRGLLTYRDLPCPFVCCNFLVVDFTKINGPTRQIKGTQHIKEEIPSLDEEPDWMKLSTVCPAPAGAVLIRDVRAWHGGTPNLSNVIRAIPNIEFYAPWFNEPQKKSISFSDFESLTDHGKNICKFIVTDSNEKLKTGIKKNLGGIEKTNNKTKFFNFSR